MRDYVHQLKRSSGKPDPDAEIPTAEELQKLLLEDGIKPEENLGSRAIIGRTGEIKLVNYFFLDASAIIKRYIPETGTPKMNYFFASVPSYRMICLFEGGGEVIFVFGRRKNEGRITAIRFNEIKQRFLTEVIHRTEVVKVLSIKGQIGRSWDLIEKTFDQQY